MSAELTIAEARSLEDASLSEDRWQAEVIRFLQGQGWRCMAVRRNVHLANGEHTTAYDGMADVGFVDILAARAGVVAFLELKTMSKKSIVKPEQVAWLNAISGAEHTAKEWGTFKETPLCLVRGDESGPDVWTTVLRPCHRQWLYSNFTTIPGLMV